MVIFRAGLAVDVPPDYASEDGHIAMVQWLNQPRTYEDVVRFLNRHVVSWLAVDVLTGQPWAQRFLNTTAKLALSDRQQDRRVAAAGQRALWRVVTGIPPRMGRPRRGALTQAEAEAVTRAVAFWRPTLTASRAADEAEGYALVVSCAQRRWGGLAKVRVLRAVLHRRLKPSRVLVTCVSLETGVSRRRVMASLATSHVMVYG